MKVSVVVPVYNKAPFLKACFDSIRAQTFKEFELIAVDDASTDDSLAVLRGIDDPRLRIVPLPRNLGPSGAVQRAIDEAKGEYIVRMDADDLMMAERIERQVAFMDAHPEVGASGTALELFGRWQDVWTFPATDADCRALAVFGIPISQGTSVLRRGVLLESGVRFRDDWPRIGEDWMFWVHLAQHTRLANLEVPLLKYRRGEQNISHGTDRTVTYRGPINAVLDQLGIAHGPADVDAHLMAIQLFAPSPTTAAVRACRAWLDGIREWNIRTGHTDPAAMESRLARQWDVLFYRLADGAAWRPTLMHLGLPGERKMAHWAYWAKVRSSNLVRSVRKRR